MQAHLHQEKLEKLRRPRIVKPANKSSEKVLRSFTGQNHEKPLISTPDFQVRRFESDEVQNKEVVVKQEEDFIKSENKENVEGKAFKIVSR